MFNLNPNRLTGFSLGLPSEASYDGKVATTT